MTSLRSMMIGFAFNDGAFGAMTWVMRPQDASAKAKPRSCAEGAVIA